MADKTKTYEKDGVRYAFDAVAFNRAFKERAKMLGVQFGEYTQIVSEECSVSEKAVSTWRYGQNAPLDVELVASLESLLDMGPGALLIEQEAVEMSKLTKEQHESVARVYRAVSDFLYMLDMTDGCVWKGYQVYPGSPYAAYITPSPEFTGDDMPRIDGEDLADAGYSWTCHVLHREWPLIGNHPVYEELAEFMDGTMLDIWDGKTDPDYRFHYAGKFDNPDEEPYKGYGEKYAGWIDSVQADKEIREIISRYL